jgi:hypothetical protein
MPTRLQRSQAGSQHFRSQLTIVAGGLPAGSRVSLAHALPRLNHHSFYDVAQLSCVPRPVFPASQMKRPEPTRSQNDTLRIDTPRMVQALRNRDCRRGFLHSRRTRLEIAGGGYFKLLIISPSRSMTSRRKSCRKSAVFASVERRLHRFMPPHPSKSPPIAHFERPSTCGQLSASRNQGRGKSCRPSTVIRAAPAASARPDSTNAKRAVSYGKH